MGKSESSDEREHTKAYLFGPTLCNTTVSNSSSQFCAFYIYLLSPPSRRLTNSRYPVEAVAGRGVLRKPWKAASARRGAGSVDLVLKVKAVCTQ